MTICSEESQTRILIKTDNDEKNISVHFNLHLCPWAKAGRTLLLNINAQCHAIQQAVLYGDESAFHAPL